MEFLITGLIVGFFSGVIGIGGGAITIAILLFLGVDIKTAIVASSIQMFYDCCFDIDTKKQ